MRGLVGIGHARGLAVLAHPRRPVQRADGVAHPEDRDHPASDLTDLREIGRRAVGALAEHELFGDPAAEQGRHPLDQQRPRVQALVGRLGQPRHALDAAARDDADLVQQPPTGQRASDETVAGLVVGDDEPLLG